MSDAIVAKIPSTADSSIIDYDRVYQAAKAAEVLPDPVDYDRIAELVETKMPDFSNFDIDGLATKIAEKVAVPDYDVLVDEEGRKEIAQGVVEALDYELLSEKVAEKVVVPVAEVPEPETIDYELLSDKVAEKVIVPEVTLPEPEALDYEMLSDKVAEKVVLPDVEIPEPETIDYELLSEKVAEKIIIPQPEVPTYDVVVDADGAKSIADCVAAAIDLDSVSEKIAEKVVVPEVTLPEPEALDYDLLSEKVAEKIVVPQPEKTEIDYETLSKEVAEKVEVPAFEVLVDEEGAEKIADAVVEKIRACCPAKEEESVCEAAEEENGIAAEETQEEAKAEETETEAVEETKSLEAENTEESQTTEMSQEAISVEEETIAEQAVEEVSEEKVEEIADKAEDEAAVADAAPETDNESESETETENQTESEAYADEAIEAAETSASTEIAAADAETNSYDEVENNLVDADTGLVIRLKRSFTAKMKQSEDNVKGYYSKIKNELTSYKRLNSNLSWHGDRFNFGRETVAKLNICGKTLCFYLALDPTNPDYKTTVYHQRDVSSQKAYEHTPFMVKVKSDAGVKKALRLVGFLAEKLGTDKRENFEPVDYVQEFEHESTKQLLEKGLIKVTKEKKVVLDFN